MQQHLKGSHGRSCFYNQAGNAPIRAGVVPQKGYMDITSGFQVLLQLGLVFKAGPRRQSVPHLTAQNSSGLTAPQPASTTA